MPAVAVKRGELVLFDVIGRKGFVDGLLTRLFLIFFIKITYPPEGGMWFKVVILESSRG